MQIIPVIDLRSGVVVRAQAGQRKDYRPIQSLLAKTCDPIEIVQGFFTLGSFDTLYIADLDAIMQSGDNRTVISRISEVFPKLRLWVDPGLRHAKDFVDWRLASNIDLVLGSESLRDPFDLNALDKGQDYILSLDFLGSDFLGPMHILTQAHLWPHRLIVMTLKNIGLSAGPDWRRLEKILASAGDRSVYAAGGVRGEEDLRTLKAMGAAGVLVASALHQKKLSFNTVR
jgi:phosphoribosylformimino-5-aminoimidazole carboxamide ribotide isomerase